MNKNTVIAISVVAAAGVAAGAIVGVLKANKHSKKNAGMVVY